MEDCWLFAGALNDKGYGYISWRGMKFSAHRTMYENFIGKIPKKYQIDHLCRVHHCINPSHLEAVTQQENILRGFGVTAINAHKTHCSRGHEFTIENTKIYRNGRQCKACHRIDKRTSKQRAKMALAI